MMREKLGRAIQNSAKQAARMSVANNELTGNWLKRLDATAVTGEAKDSQSQLEAVLDFYNRAATSNAKAIDWEGCKERIHTQGVVDKIHAKYQAFMESDYTIESAVAKCGHTTEKMQALDISMQYNFMLYFVHYAMHLEQLETLRNLGDVSKISNLEAEHLMPEVETLQAAHQEIGNTAPEDYNEDGMVTRICTQFAWGTRHTVPFNHSQDAINSIVATMGKNGK